MAQYRDPDAGLLRQLQAHLIWMRSDGEAGQRLVLRDADLSGLRLSGLTLQNADLGGARLIGAQLDGARLEGTILDGANLSGVRGLTP